MGSISQLHTQLRLDFIMLRFGFLLSTLAVASLAQGPPGSSGPGAGGPSNSGGGAGGAGSGPGGPFGAILHSLVAVLSSKVALIKEVLSQDKGDLSLVKVVNSKEVP